MSAINLYFTQPITSYVQKNDGLYRFSRVARSTLRWAALCEDVVNFSRSTVEALKMSAISITVCSSLLLIPRIIATSCRIWNGVDDRGRESTHLDYAFIVGDVSKVALIVLYKLPPLHIAANGAGIYIYGHRLHDLGNKYMNVSPREESEDDGYLTLEIVRTITCIAYSALRVLSAFLGVALLVDAAFLSLMCVKQFMHFGLHYYQEIYHPTMIPDPA